MEIKSIDLNNPKQKIFFISDLHFSHAGILKMHPKFRAFKSVDEMDNRLVQLWNSSVGNDDIVFNLGDFCFGDREKIASIAKRLNGKHILITGNHDNKIKDGSLDQFFFARYSYLKISASRAGQKQDIVMFHYPIFEWDRMHYGAIHLYGHVHGNDLSGVLGTRAINVCYDFNGRFLSLEEILQSAKNAPPREHSH